MISKGILCYRTTLKILEVESDFHNNMIEWNFQKECVSYLELIRGDN